MKERDLDLLILQYLQKNDKYKDVAQVFRQRSEVGKTGVDGSAAGAHHHQPTSSSSLSHQLGADHNLQDLLLFYAAEQDPQKFVDSFDQLVTFVDGSLDLYKPELQRVLYPVFVHIYLQLVSYGASQKAAELLKRYRRRLVEVGGRQSSVRAQELQELQSVALAQHLAVNPFARAARSSRSNLRLCTYSFELLMHHLQGSKQWLVLNIINKHVAFELHEGRPLLLDVLAGDEEGTGLLQGRAGEAAGAINSTPLNLSLLKDNTEDAYAGQRVQALEDSLNAKINAATVRVEDAKRQEEENTYDDSTEREAAAATQQARAALNRLKAHKERVLTAARHKLKVIQDSRRTPTVPLLPPSPKIVAAEQQHLSKRVVVTPNDLPSCCFFTLVNTRHGGVTALTTSPDTKHLAAGFSDSVVRLYNLELLGKARSKLSKQHKANAQEAKRQKGGGVGADGDHMDIDTEMDELQDELADLSEQHVKHLYGHSGSITGLSYSSDQGLLLSSSTDGTVRLWSTAWHKNLAAYRGHTLPVWDVAACPHGTYFVSGGADQTARCWSTEVARPLRMFVGHQSDVDVVSWHPNSHYVATGSSDRTVRLWDVASGSCVRVLTAQTSCVTCLGFSPDGQQLAAGTEDGAVAVYDLGSARRMALLEGHIGPVWSLSYSRGSGSILASGGADRTVRLFSCPRGDNVVECVVGEELADAVVGGETSDATPAAAGAGAAGGAGGGRGAAAGGRGGAAGAAAAAVAGAEGGVLGGGAGSGMHSSSSSHGPPWQPYQLLKTFTTQSMPVVYVGFSQRNLLLAGGPWTLQPKVISSSGQHIVGAGKGR